MKMRLTILMIAALAITAAAGCAAKKPANAKPDQPVFQGKFESARQFFEHYNQVVGIMVRKKLDGQPVDTSWIDPAFREKICLTVTITNHCSACHAVHSREAKKAGLQAEEIRKLIELKPEDFTPAEHAALIWARNYILFKGQIPLEIIQQNLERYYDEQRRRDILAVVIVMDFANKWNNTMTGQVLDEKNVGGPDLPSDRKPVF